MASKVPQLRTLPWPTFVGASIALHIGALSFTLPRMLRVSQPTDSTANIPVTLVDEGVAPPPQSAPTSNTQPLVESPPTAAAPQTVPLGGQNIAAKPTQPTSPQPTSPQPATPSTESGNRNAQSPPAQPTEERPIQKEPTQPDQDTQTSEETPQLPPESSASGETEVTGEPDREATASQPTVVIIEDIQIPEIPGAGKTTAQFAVPQKLQIPFNTACPISAIPNSFKLKVEIMGNGQITSLQDGLGNLYDSSPTVVSADCFLMQTINTNSNIRFQPTQPDTDFNRVEQALGPSVEADFILSFN